MRREEPRTRRLILLGIALLAVLLAVVATWVVLEPVPDLEASPPPPPPPPVAEAPSPDPMPDPGRLPKQEASTKNPVQTWHVGGAHVPECWPANLEPKPLYPDHSCTYGDRVALCQTPNARVPDDITPAAIDSLVGDIESVLGVQREGRLTVMLYHHRAFAKVRRRLGLPPVAGFFDGHVHVRAAFGHRRTREVLRHELAHAVMAPAIGCAPRSVHEGVADWFEGDYHLDAWTYLLWRGYPFDGRALDRLITSEDDYEVGLAYAEGAARVRHAVSTAGEDVVASWLDRVGTGRLSRAGAAWADLAAASETPVMATVSQDLLAEPWTDELHARLQEHSVACVRRMEGPLDVYGAHAFDSQCALVDRDPEDPALELPDLKRPLGPVIEDYESLLEQASDRALLAHQLSIDIENGRDRDEALEAYDRMRRASEEAD